MNFKKVTEILKLIVPILILLVAIISFVIAQRSNNPRLDIVDLNKENLTDITSIPDLQTTFRFRDSSVVNVWRLDARVINAGSTTIIGNGDQSNLVSNGISIEFGESFRILNVSAFSDDIQTDFYIQKNRKKGDLSFDQWRSREAIDFTFYLEQLDQSVSPDFEINERDIIDGEIRMQTETLAFNPLSKYFNATITLSITWVILILFVGIVVFVFYLLFDFAITQFKYLIWKFKYQKKLSSILKDNNVQESGKSMRRSRIEKKIMTDNNIPETPHFYPLITFIIFSITIMVFILAILLIIPYTK